MGVGVIEVVIFFVVFGLAGSILWVLPSPSQRKKAALRTKALSLGLNVRFCDKQYTSIVDGDEYMDPLICYASRPSQSREPDYEVTLMKVWKNGAYIWRLDSMRNLSEEIECLISKRAEEIGIIQGVSFIPSGYRFYWLESASPDELVKLVKELDDLWREVNKSATRS
jgi:hypothetical protein